QRSRHSISEKVDMKPRDQHVKKGDGDGREHAHQAGKCVVPRSLRTPRFRSSALVTMENQSHPEPTGEKRHNAGDQAGNNGCTQGVHKFSSVTRTHSCEQNFTPTAIGQPRGKSSRTGG